MEYQKRDYLRELYYPQPVVRGGSCTPYASPVVRSCG
jgi:D-ribose pyranose/furanose isomerase RbsD